MGIDREVGSSPRVSRLRQIDLNLFVVFEAIFAQGTLTAAGEQLGLTQPAVSHALRRLRGMLKDELFVRHGGGFVPTSFARSVIKDVRRALLLLDGQTQESMLFEPATSNAIFRIALDEWTEAILLAPLLSRLSKEAPNISIVSMGIKQAELEHALAGGLVDLAVGIAVPVGVEVRRRTLATDTLVVMARSNHPKLLNGLSLETYLALDHVLVSRDSYGIGEEDRELARIGLRRTVIMRCQSQHAACKTVAVSDLLTTVSHLHAHSLQPTGGVTTHPFPLEMPNRVMTMFWHVSLQDDAGHSWLRHTVSAAIALVKPTDPV